jgi:exopolysaccharide production protein ExoZ
MTSDGLSPADSPRRRELQGLQFVRANAAILVVVSHLFGTLALPKYLNTEVGDGIFDAGGVGVQIFFVLSGFIIVYVSLREHTLTPSLSASAFLMKRFVRIVPFLWIVVLAYAAVRYIGAREFTPVEYLNSIFLIPVGDVAPGVVWTLRHEALFYLVFAASFLWLPRARWVLYAWCASGVAVWALRNVGVATPNSELFNFLFGRYNALFGCGVLVGLAFQRFRLASRVTVSAPWIAWILIFAGSLLAFFAKDAWGPVAVAAASTFTLLAGLVAPQSSSVFARLWETLGNASYAIYLTHAVVLSVLATVWTRLLGSDTYVLAATTGVVLSIGVGVAAHFCVEKPVIRWARSAVSGSRPRAARQEQT